MTTPTHPGGSRDVSHTTQSGIAVRTGAKEGQAGEYIFLAKNHRKATSRLARFPAGHDGVDVLYLHSLSLLGCIQRDSGHFPQSQRTFERAIELGKERFGARHVEVAQLRVAMGGLLKFRGRYDEA